MSALAGYTIEEIEHLSALMESAFLGRFNDDWNCPEYCRHLAFCAIEGGDRPLALDMFERAEAIECGMENGGETL